MNLSYVEPNPFRLQRLLRRMGAGVADDRRRMQCTPAYCSYIHNCPNLSLLSRVAVPYEMANTYTVSLLHAATLLLASTLLIHSGRVDPHIRHHNNHFYAPSNRLPYTLIIFAPTSSLGRMLSPPLFLPTQRLSLRGHSF